MNKILSSCFFRLTDLQFGCRHKCTCSSIFLCLSIYWRVLCPILLFCFSLAPFSLPSSFFPSFHTHTIFLPSFPLFSTFLPLPSFLQSLSPCAPPFPPSFLPFFPLSLPSSFSSPYLTPFRPVPSPRGRQGLPHNPVLPRITT